MCSRYEWGAKARWAGPVPPKLSHLVAASHAGLGAPDVGLVRTEKIPGREAHARSGKDMTGNGECTPSPGELPETSPGRKASVLLRLIRFASLPVYEAAGEGVCHPAGGSAAGQRRTPGPHLHRTGAAAELRFGPASGGRTEPRAVPAGPFRGARGLRSTRCARIELASGGTC